MSDRYRNLGTAILAAGQLPAPVAHHLMATNQHAQDLLQLARNPHLTDQALINSWQHHTTTKTKKQLLRRHGITTNTADQLLDTAPNANIASTIIRWHNPSQAACRRAWKRHPESTYVATALCTHPNLPTSWMQQVAPHAYVGSHLTWVRDTPYVTAADADQALQRAAADPNEFTTSNILRAAAILLRFPTLQAAAATANTLLHAAARLQLTCTPKLRKTLTGQLDQQFGPDGIATWSHDQLDNSIHELLALAAADHPINVWRNTTRTHNNLKQLGLLAQDDPRHRTSIAQTYNIRQRTDLTAAKTWADLTGTQITELINRNLPTPKAGNRALQLAELATHCTTQQLNHTTDNTGTTVRQLLAERLTCSSVRRTLGDRHVTHLHTHLVGQPPTLTHLKALGYSTTQRRRLNGPDPLDPPLAGNPTQGANLHIGAVSYTTQQGADAAAWLTHKFGPDNQGWQLALNMCHNPRQTPNQVKTLDDVTHVIELALQDNRKTAVHTPELLASRT